MTAATVPTFKLKLGIPRQIEIEGRAIDREFFFGWLWETFSEAGLLGVHEGTLLSEQAADRGFETDSWTVDSGEAPRERDWVESQATLEAELYFASEQDAKAARARLGGIRELMIGAIEEQKPQDWDADWKASFKGAEIPPFWRIAPPWETAPARDGQVILKINPGAGFGTGTHETTQLCLSAIGERAARFRGARILDFGSGSGILAIGAALLGASVDAVEIDPLAIDNATENAALNGVEARITYSHSLAASRAIYPVVIANILRPVLLEFAKELTSRLDDGGTLILSGLIESDVAEVRARYAALLGREPEVRALNEWRALVWG